MNNYCGTPNYQQNIYANTYSLWENSAYYDINNLSPQNFSSSWHRGNDEDFETRFTSGPTESKDAEPPDHRNRRTVKKSSLYEDPDTFYHNITCSSLFSWGALIPSSTLAWPQLKRQKAGEDSDEGPSVKKGNSALSDTVSKMVAKPFKLSKAESMMQKMGWHGGPLGRSKSGIVEPIRPNTVYASNRIGFGKASQPLPNRPNNSLIRNNFTMNVLYNLYEFVKNNNEVELLFDCKLTNEERKRIHYLVNDMLNVDDVNALQCDTDAQIEIVLQICDVNCYILSTQSEGESSNRQICIYKEAPKHVYLIIPDDLRDEETEDQAVSQPDEPSDNEPEEETNPFLRSITRNLKKTKDDEKVQKAPPEDPPKADTISKKILEYFTEFSERKKYSQFKFLGPFNKDEWCGIRDFMENVALYLSKDPCKYKDVFDKISFELGEDITGNAVINKRPK